MTTKPSIKLVYFDFEGVLEPVRLALVLAGVDFEDVRIPFSEWPALKPKTPQGLLPIMELNGNGEWKTQSGAMLRYCGRLGENSFLYPADKMYDIEEAIGLITDLNNAFIPCLSMANRPQLLGYPEGYQLTEEGKERSKALRHSFHQVTLPLFLTHVEGLLEQSAGPWLVEGDKPTIADCFAVPSLRRFSCGYIDDIPTNCLDSHPKVVQYLERFCALPEIQGRYSTGIGSMQQPL